MFNKIKSHLLFKDILVLGNTFFLIGIFFLGSAIPVSFIFLGISLVIAIYKKRNSFLKDKWNYPFFICTFLC